MKFEPRCSWIVGTRVQKQVLSVFDNTPSSIDLLGLRASSVRWLTDRVWTSWALSTYPRPQLKVPNVLKWEVEANTGRRVDKDVIIVFMEEKYSYWIFLYKTEVNFRWVYARLTHPLKNNLTLDTAWTVKSNTTLLNHYLSITTSLASNFVLTY